MKGSVLFVVLCAGVAMAAGLIFSGDLGSRLPAVLLRSASANESKAVRDKINEAFQKATKCFEDKHPADGPTKIADTNAIIIECLNNHKDNTECCKKAGLTDDKCAKEMCNGKPPVNATLSEAELKKCGDDVSEAVVLEVVQCFLDSH